MKVTATCPECGRKVKVKSVDINLGIGKVEIKLSCGSSMSFLFDPQ